jgi:hypothetical protein
VSILPNFAQPYRFVQNATIEKFVNGPWDVDVARWQVLLRRYWAKYVSWLPKLIGALSTGKDRAPPNDTPYGWWMFFISSHRDFAAASMSAVRRFQITYFGRYRCHRPCPPQSQS